MEDTTTALIYIVDDNEVNIAVLTRLMQKFGFKTVTFLRAQAALDSLQLELPDLILLDIMMPEMDGYDFLTALKEQGEASDIPVIFISALTETSALAKGFSLGGVDYITKPFRPPELLARVTTHLELSRTRRKLLASNKAIQQANTALMERTEELAHANAELERKKNEIEQQHEKYVSLLNSILPGVISERLLKGEQLIAERYSEATMIFTDIVGFTPFASQHTPEEIVALLNSIFSRIDGAATKYGVEKVKTIGDAYFGVCGAPTPIKDHCERVALFALDVMSFAEGIFEEYGVRFRMGINTGSVIGGVIGVSKPTFDLWGDAVNVASRMESSSLPGIIQVTQAVADRLASRGFVLEQRGEIDVKGKGLMSAWQLVAAP